MCVSHMWKLGQLNIKTKIYITIKGLIIFFIKLQFFNKIFRPLDSYISQFLILSFNPNLNFTISLLILFLIHFFHNSRFSLDPY